MSARISILLIYLFVAVYLLPMFPHGGSANELTRWATAASLVENGSFEISWTEPLLGKNVDTAVVGEKTYSNKAPGTAVLAAPFYALSRIFVGPPNASNIRTSWFLMRLFIGTLPLLLLGLWLYRKGADEFSLATFLFATPLFLYSLLFFSHVFVAVLVYFAFRLLYDAGGGSLKKCFWAGVLSGVAVTSEFSAVFAIFVFAAGLLFTGKRERYRRLSYFILGGAPFALILLLYNNALFGSPFSISYAHESFPEWAGVASQGVFGIGFPTLSNGILLLLSPSRGLLFYSPILVLSIIVLFSSRERTSLRHRIKIWAAIVSFLIMCGHGAAHGGWAMGARYLILILPLLLDSFVRAEGSRFSSIAQGSLFASSVLLCTIPALTFPFPPPEFGYPHNNFWKPFLVNDHWFTPTLANSFGLPSGVAGIVPVLLALLGVIGVVCWKARQPKSFALAALAGSAAVGIYVFLPNLDDKETQFRRATIAERFFRPANRLESIRDDARTSTDAKALQRINDFEWTIADARAFAPDDFPYLETRALTPSPTAELKRAVGLQKAGNSIEAEHVLQSGKETYSFGRCDFSTGLAIVYYTTNRKDLALQELESVQSLVAKGARPNCVRSQFLLGSLYQELNRSEDARRLFREFMANSEGATDPETKSYRQKLSGAGL
ncbi:MAG: hypothetical protein DMF06_16785 [Verrucomicrobia bacterium]|nr:MAG: hypothetical protein DMF06_16785 [Verrucomicrobiota bacterium]